MKENPQEWLANEQESNGITGIIFYRGRWWVMWPDYLRSFQDIKAAISSGTRCKLFAVCSQSQSEANLAQSQWNLHGYTAVVGDSDNEFVNFIKQEYLPGLCITDCTNRCRGPMSAQHYPRGAVQPAFIFFIGRQPVVKWACQPSKSNLQGSVGRPRPDLVWKKVLECKSRSDNGQAFDCVNVEELEKSGSVAEACCKTCCIVS
jgi:hypothetical protein